VLGDPLEPLRCVEALERPQLLQELDIDLIVGVLSVSSIEVVYRRL
jgi:hypothetical protein